jgi:dihydrofolate synthase / folylpolyglutamate synthase
VRPLPPHRVAGYLAARVRFGIKFGLETMRALVAEMGHPERAYPSLLIAGTNGKGSAAAYCDAALRASGLKTGRYTSPHLVRVNERITVDGRPITDAAFARAVHEVRDAAARLVERRVLRGHPTFFEVLTAAAFAHFRSQKVEVAVLEVGLGGRLDATNVAEPAASAIVSVDLDHEVYLGRTLAKIAREKAGVLRSGRATVVGPLAPEARRAVLSRAREEGARVVEARRGARLEPLRTRSRDDRHNRPDRPNRPEGHERHNRPEGQEAHAPEGFDLSTPGHRYNPVVPLPGAHQRDNLLVAIRLLEEARRAGIAVRLERVAQAVSRVDWPGRLQRLPGSPEILLDGAHNPAGARALAAHLRDGPPFVLVFGAMADKDVKGLARPLFPLASGIVLTTPRISRAATPRALARRAGTLAAGARHEPRVGRALALATRLARAHGPETRIVVAGSLYLVGAVLRLRRATPRGSRSRARRAATRRRGRSPAPRAPRSFRAA